MMVNSRKGKARPACWEACEDRSLTGITGQVHLYFATGKKHCFKYEYCYEIAVAYIIKMHTFTHVIVIIINACRGTSDSEHHTDIITGDEMRYVVVIESKFIHRLQQGATSNVLQF